MKLWLTIGLGIALSSFPWAQEVEVPGNAGSKTYANASRSGLVLATEEIWYLEEFDSRERPVSGTLWKKGKIAEQTSWLYEGTSQQAVKRIWTGAEKSIETEYDESGKVIMILESDLKATMLGKTLYTYDQNDLITDITTTSGNRETRTEFEYGADRTLEKKRVYLDGKITIAYLYADEENWTETIYSDERPVLVVTYVDGIRIKDGNENKH